MGPNILLIILDAARRDALEPYGASPGSTPVVAQLAARGRALNRIYATAPWTTPSHVSFFTGLMPRAAGLQDVPSLEAARRILEPKTPRFLPEVLRAAGFETAGVSANPWASDLSGVAAGFDQFTLVDSGRKTEFGSDGRRARLKWFAEGVRGRVDDGAAEIERVLGRWAGNRSKQQFFCFVNLLECHFPYLPPRPYGRISTLDRMRAVHEAQQFFTLDAIYRVCGGALEVPLAVLERARRLYRASIRYMDDCLGRILERLDAARILDDTLVIVTADHGENLGDNGLLGHALSLDERLIHVPFVAAGPGSDSIRMTSLAELPRELAKIVGIEDHPWRDGLPEGVGLAQSDPIGAARTEAVFQTLDQMGVVEERYRERFTLPLECAVGEQLKLVRCGSREEFFDLSADPLERGSLEAHQLEPAQSTEADRLRGALEHAAMAVVPPPGGNDERPPAATPSDTADLERRMKMLGYM